MTEGRLSIERRVNPRLSLKIPTKFRREGDAKVLQAIREHRNPDEKTYSMDLSLGGVNLVMDQPLRVGEVLRIDLFLLEKVTSATIFAEVIWSNENNAGLKFLMMPVDEQDALRTFLEKSSNP